MSSAWQRMAAWAVVVIVAIACAFRVESATRRPVPPFPPPVVRATVEVRNGVSRVVLGSGRVLSPDGTWVESDYWWFTAPLEPTLGRKIQFSVWRPHSMPGSLEYGLETLRLRPRPLWGDIWIYDASVPEDADGTVELEFIESNVRCGER